MNLEYISATGSRLPLVTNEYFELTHVDGQTAASTSVSSNVIGGADGDSVTNVQADPRNIILDLRIKSGVDVEAAKRHILKIVKIKQRGWLEWTQRERTLTISGIVENVEMPRWTNKVVMQITLRCDQPFWEDAEFIVQQISEAIDLHYFTTYENDMLYFTEDGIALGEYDTIRTRHFHNDGDVSVGLELSIVALDTVTNPIIYDGNGNFFGIGYGDGERKVVMEMGDNIIVKTHKGGKSVTMHGVNLLPKIRPKSTWLQMAAGDNLFTINSDDDSLTNMKFSIIYKQRYI